MDYSPPVSSVHGISQARILEWVSISFSRRSSHPGIKPMSPALAGRVFTTEPPGKPQSNYTPVKNKFSSVQFSCSVMSNSAISWTAAHQASLPMEFSRQEYWSGLPFPASRNLSDPEIRTASLASPLLYCSVQLPSCIRLFATPLTEACQASMSILELTQTHVH